jgi:hypothetical protein
MLDSQQCDDDDDDKRDFPGVSSLIMHESSHTYMVAGVRADNE